MRLATLMLLLVSVACQQSTPTAWQELQPVRTDTAYWIPPACWSQEAPLQVSRQRFAYQGHDFKVQRTELADFLAVHFADTCGMQILDSLELNGNGYALASLLDSDAQKDNRRYLLAGVYGDAQAGMTPMILFHFVENDRSTSRPTSYPVLVLVRDSTLSQPLTLPKCFGFEPTWVNRVGAEEVTFSKWQFPMPGDNDSPKRLGFNTFVLPR